jgi:hypothetical protein
MLSGRELPGKTARRTAKFAAETAIDSRGHSLVKYAAIVSATIMSTRSIF